MSKPRRHLPPFDMRRADTDTRIALGSKKLRPGQPAECCAYCWPALVAADMYDIGGNARCLHCAGNPDRERKLPAFRADVWRIEEAA